MSEAIIPVSALVPGPLVISARALTRRIQFVFPPTKFQFRFVPAKITARAWGELYQGTQPFVGLGWNGLASSGDSIEFTGSSNWTVLLAVKATGGKPDVRYLGDGVGPGLLTFVPAMIAALNGLRIAGAGTAIVKKVSNVYADDWGDDMAMAMMDVTVGMSLPVAATLTAPADLSLLTEISENWAFSTPDGAVPAQQSEWDNPNVAS